jgi:pyruvate/2-oxoglutarate dehydrogenase complex dihydrolipoamide dehydrogenase (E3) component
VSKRARARSPSATPRLRTRACDVAIIGAGPAGLAAAYDAAAAGLDVVLFERSQLGGTSLNSGSIPSKALIRAATLFAGARDAARLLDAGMELPVPSVRRIVDHLRRIERRVAAYDSPARLARANIELHFGAACFVDPRTIATGRRHFRFRHAIIATGAVSAPPSFPGLAPGGYLTSESVFSLRRLPQSLAVVGGGPLGCELAQAFCRLGSEVTIIQDDGKFLPLEERDAAQVLAQAMGHDGVKIRLNTRVISAARTASGVRLETESYRKRAHITAAQVLVSVGRVPNMSGLQLEAARIKAEGPRGILTDDFLRTSNQRVFAAGDVCMAQKYTHVASRTGRIALHNAMHRSKLRCSDLTIPWCTFCSPEIAHVGLQVWEARERRIPVKTYTVLMHDVDRAVTDCQENGFVKLHAAEGTDRIIGATIVAARASEMINEVCVAMHHRIGLRGLAEVMHTYPAQSAAIRRAAASFQARRQNA